MKGCPRSWVLSAGPAGGAGPGGHPVRGTGNRSRQGLAGARARQPGCGTPRTWAPPRLRGPAAWCHAGEGTGAGARAASDGLAGRRGLLGRDSTGTRSAERGSGLGRKGPSPRRWSGGARGHGWPRRGGCGGRAVGGLLEAPGVLVYTAREPLKGRGAWRRHGEHQKMLRRAPGWVAGGAQRVSGHHCVPTIAASGCPLGTQQASRSSRKGRCSGPISPPAKAEGQGLANHHRLCCRCHPAVQLVGGFPEAGGAHRLITLHRVVPPGGPQALRGHAQH